MDLTRPATRAGDHVRQQCLLRRRAARVVAPDGRSDVERRTDVTGDGMMCAALADGIRDVETNRVQHVLPELERLAAPRHQQIAILRPALDLSVDVYVAEHQPVLAPQPTPLILLVRVVAELVAGAFLVLLPVLLKNVLVGTLGWPTDLAAHFEFIIVGALIIIFLIAEPHGLAQLWRVAKEKLRLWPFPH